MTKSGRNFSDGDYRDHGDNGDYGDYEDHGDYGDHGDHGDYGDHGDCVTGCGVERCKSCHRCSQSAVCGGVKLGVSLLLTQKYGGYI